MKVKPIKTPDGCAEYEHKIKVSECDTWDAFALMAQLNHAILVKYRKVNKNGYPMRIEELKRIKAYPQPPEVIWHNIVDQMIEAFSIINDEWATSIQNRVGGRCGIDEAKVKIGLALYADYFECIWD